MPSKAGIYVGGLEQRCLVYMYNDIITVRRDDRTPFVFNGPLKTCVGLVIYKK